MAMADEPVLAEENRFPLKLAAWLAIAVGILALLSPFYASVAVTLLLGINFLIGGVLEAFAAFRAQRWIGTLGLLLFAVVSVVAGVMIIVHPLAGMVTLTLVCIIAIFAAGIAKLVWAFRVPADRGRWLLVISGILSILVAAMLYSSFPFSATWALGVLVGINLIVEGTTILGVLRHAD